MVQLFFKSDSAIHSAELIRAVFEEELLCVELTEFLTNTDCNNLIKQLEPFQMDDFANLQGTARKIGIPVYDSIGRQAEYFQQSREDALVKLSAYQEIIHKLLTTIALSGSGVTIATNLEGDQYYPGIINEFHSTLKLHFDSAAKEQEGWIPIERIKRQFAYVIKLTACDGGETYIYPRRWESSHQPYFNKADGYSYDMRVVEGATEIAVAGPKGSLIIFNSSCYHRVAPVVGGRRLTLGGFIGELPNGQFVMWG